MKTPWELTWKFSFLYAIAMTFITFGTISFAILFYKSVN